MLKNHVPIDIVQFFPILMVYKTRRNRTSHYIGTWGLVSTRMLRDHSCLCALSSMVWLLQTRIDHSPSKVKMFSLRLLSLKSLNQRFESVSIFLSQMFLTIFYSWASPVAPCPDLKHWLCSIQISGLFSANCCLEDSKCEISIRRYQMILLLWQKQKIPITRPGGLLD